MSASNSRAIQRITAAKWAIIAFALIAGGATYALSTLLPTEYEATAQVQIISSQQLAGDPLGADELLQLTNVYAQEGQTAAVKDLAYRSRPRTEGLVKFRDRVGIEVGQEGGLVALNATAPTARGAADDANAYATAFQSSVDGFQARRRLQAQRRLDAQIRATRRAAPRGAAGRREQVQRVQALETQAAQTLSAPTDTSRQLEQARPPAAPSSPKPLRNGLLAGLTALFLGALIAYVRPNVLDQYVDAEELSTDLGLPIVGQIPKRKRRAPGRLEAFRKLQMGVEVLASQTAPRRPVSVLVTGAGPGAGKTYVAAGLARAYSAHGNSTVAIDGDTRRSTLHESLGGLPGPGLSEYLASTPGDGPPLADLLQLVRSDETGVETRLLAAGQPTFATAEQLTGDGLPRLLDELSAEAEVAVIDSPPLLAVVDAVGMARACGVALMVVDLKKTKRDEARAAVELLHHINVPVAGLVVNRDQSRTANEYDDYGTRPLFNSIEESSPV